LTGKITFDEDKVARIFPLVSGHITDVKVSLGDYVEKGQILATIRSADMANYYNEYKSSQSELSIAKKNMEVTGDMRKSGVSSDKDYLVAQGDYQKALAQYNKISEILKINGSILAANDSAGSGYVLKAPISGFIVEKNITIGMDLRSDESNSLFTISDLKNVWAVANVYESDIAKIKIDASTDVTTLSYPDKIFTGKVEKISNILDAESRVMNVKIRLDNIGYLLKPGMFTHINIHFPESKKMLTTHSNAILFDENKYYVLRYRNKCDVTMQQVSVYKSLNDVAYLTSDSLQPGDQLIVRNGLFILSALKKL
jgi:cobalt-zinc-cadmium efflux system membrane fusion protein